MSGSVVANRVRRGFYLDSVVLMRLSVSLSDREGVESASLMIGTPSNLQILDEAGLLTAEGRGAGPDDLILAVRATERDALEAGLDAATEALERAAEPEERSDLRFPGLRSAFEALPGANLSIVSVPGPYAVPEARRALRLDLNVLLFSDHVAVEGRGCAQAGSGPAGPPGDGAGLRHRDHRRGAARLRQPGPARRHRSRRGLRNRPAGVLGPRPPGRRGHLTRHRRGRERSERRGRGGEYPGRSRPARSGRGDAAHRHRLETARTPHRGGAHRPPRRVPKAGDAVSHGSVRGGPARQRAPRPQPARCRPARARSKRLRERRHTKRLRSAPGCTLGTYCGTLYGRHALRRSPGHPPSRRGAGELQCAHSRRRLLGLRRARKRGASREQPRDTFSSISARTSTPRAGPIP